MSALDTMNDGWSDVVDQGGTADMGAGELPATLGSDMGHAYGDMLQIGNSNTQGDNILTAQNLPTVLDSAGNLVNAFKGNAFTANQTFHSYDGSASASPVGNLPNRGGAPYGAANAGLPTASGFSAPNINLKSFLPWILLGLGIWIVMRVVK